jgi:hypothetical protein
MVPSSRYHVKKMLIMLVVSGIVRIVSGLVGGLSGSVGGMSSLVE